VLVSLVWPEPAAAAGFDHVEGRIAGGAACEAASA